MRNMVIISHLILAINICAGIDESSEWLSVTIQSSCMSRRLSILQEIENSKLSFCSAA